MSSSFLGAALGVGGLFGAITLSIRGLGEFGVEDTGILACCVLLTGGFVLLCALAPLSISKCDTSAVRGAASAAVALDRSTFTRRWWESFRLVLLLAIGPAFFAPALAIARVPVHVTPKVTTLPGGVTEKIETHGTGTDLRDDDRRVRRRDIPIRYGCGNRRSNAVDAESTSREVSGHRPSCAVLTILAHGASGREPWTGAWTMDEEPCSGDRGKCVRVSSA